MNLWTALQTRLDLYNSELALASSPVLFWNLCVQLEIWISIVISVDWQLWWARPVKPPSPHPPNQLLLSLLTWQLPAAQKLYQHFPAPSPPSQYPNLTMVSCTEIKYSVCTLIRKTSAYTLSGNRKYHDKWEEFTSYYILFLSNWPFCIPKKSFFSSKYSVKFEKFVQFFFF